METTRHPRRPRTPRSGACAVETCDREDRTAGYCSTHYSRLRTTGDVQADVPIEERRTDPTPCEVEGCDRVRASRGWCAGHYQRWRKTGDVRANEPFRPKQSKWGVGRCSVEGCERASRKRGWCMKHYDRWRAHGDPEHEPRPHGWRRVTDQGYVEVRYKSQAWSEHRLVWEARHGPLLPGQNIHHKNGIRSDNRIENLEVWDTTQPAGQRPQDKIEYALDMLNRYAPELLVADTRLPVSG